MSVRGVFLIAAAWLLCSCSMFSSSAKDALAKKAAEEAEARLRAAAEQKSNTTAATQANNAPPVGQKYLPDGMTLSITADPQLNNFKNSPHTLLLCLYQLKDPNAFNQLADDPTAISKLIECNKFDSSITYTKRFVIQPGQNLTEPRNLAEGTRYIGIAAGYYSHGNEKITHLAPVTGRATTNVSIELGPNEISRVTVK